jgi:hypothetical protein
MRVGCSRDVRSSLKGVTAGIALSVALFLPTAASAGPKEDVAAAASKWAQVIGENDPDKVLPLYSDDAVLWGTLSPTVRADRAALRDYFVAAFKVLPGLKAAFGDQLIRVYDAQQSTPVTTHSLSLRMERPRPCLRATALRT